MAVKRSILVLLGIMCIMLTACGPFGSSKEEVPSDIAKVRDKSMKAVQETAHAIEGAWVDRVTNLENYSASADAMDTAEYVSMQEDLAGYAKEYKVDRLYIMTAGDETDYLLVVDSLKPGGSWHEKTVVDSTACSKAYKSGLVAAEHKGRKSGDKYYWSAYCPLFDSSGKIAYVLAADISSDKLEDYPEWISE